MPSALDTLRPVTTPEGVELDLRLAGPVARACAWAIDLGLRAVTLIAASIVLGQLGALDIGLILTCAFALMSVLAQTFRRLERNGTPCLDVELPIARVNRYLNIKRARLL